MKWLRLKDELKTMSNVCNRKTRGLRINSKKQQKNLFSELIVSVKSMNKFYLKHDRSCITKEQNSNQ